MGKGNIHRERKNCIYSRSPFEEEEANSPSRGGKNDREGGGEEGLGLAKKKIKKTWDGKEKHTRTMRGGGKNAIFPKVAKKKTIRTLKRREKKIRRRKNQIRGNGLKNKKERGTSREKGGKGGCLQEEKGKGFFASAFFLRKKGARAWVGREICQKKKGMAGGENENRKAEERREEHKIISPIITSGN